MIPKDDSLFSKMLANTFILVRVPQRNRTYKRIYIYIYNIYYYLLYILLFYIYILSHAIIEAEKSQDLQSICWRPRKADKVLVQKPGGTSPKKNQGFSPSPKTRKDHLPSSAVKLSSPALCSTQVFS